MTKSRAGCKGNKKAEFKLYHDSGAEIDFAILLCFSEEKR